MDSTPRVAILVVDDEETIHKALGRTLRHEPYEVLHAYDATEAEAILGQRPDVRAVLCDHYMPGMPGLEFMVNLRRTHPLVATVLLTAQADLAMVITAMNVGHLHRFFTKPWDSHDLRRSLRQLVGLPAVDPVTSASPASARAHPDSGLPGQDDDGAWVVGPPD